MRVNPLLPLTVLAFTGSVRAQSVEQTLKWARENINNHAVTHHVEPPARASGVKWQVERIEGCTVALKETDHRESADSVLKNGGVFGLDEDKVVTWTFDLAALLPQFVMADTSAGTPHIKIFANGDVFHTRSETVSRAVRKDGSVESTQNWSGTGNARNLTIFFDSPTTDNKALVHRLENDLRDAVYQCAVRASTR